MVFPDSRETKVIQVQLVVLVSPAHQACLESWDPKDKVVSQALEGTLE